MVFTQVWSAHKQLEMAMRSVPERFLTPRGQRRGRLAPILGRGGDAAAGGDLDAGVEHGHFRADDGTGEHQFVEVAEVADAEDFA